MAKLDMPRCQLLDIWLMLVHSPFSIINRNSVALHQQTFGQWLVLAVIVAVIRVVFGQLLRVVLNDFIFRALILNIDHLLILINVVKSLVVFTTRVHFCISRYNNLHFCCFSSSQDPVQNLVLCGWTATHKKEKYDLRCQE